MHTAMLVDSLWVLLTRLVMRAANFAVFILLARSLSVGEFGFYGYVMSTALVLAIAFDLGLRQSGAWVIGREPAADSAVTTHVLALWLFLGAASVLACWLMLEAGGYVAGYGILALVAAAQRGADALPAHGPRDLSRPGRPGPPQSLRADRPCRGPRRHCGALDHRHTRPHGRASGCCSRLTCLPRSTSCGR